MRRWLQSTLAVEHGIAANLEFLTPGEFVARALNANVPGEHDDLSAAALRWRLYAALPIRTLLGAGRRCARCRPTCRRPIRSSRGRWPASWPRCSRSTRPGAATGCCAGTPAPTRRIRRRSCGGTSPAATSTARAASRPTCRASKAPGRPLPQGLPARVFAFATLNISPDVLRVMATQARVGTLHFYLPTPDPGLLGRPADAGREAAQRRAGSVRRRGRREPPAAGLGRGRPRFHGGARQLRGGASVRRDRRL